MKVVRKVRGGVASSLGASIVALTWLACSSTSPRPAELGGCTPAADASCSGPGAGGGGGSGPTDGGSSDGASPGESAASCGTIAVVTQNTTCVPCIEASCCTANQACSGACVSLVTCTQGCSSTDEACVSTCFNQWPTGQSAYNDLANCISGQGCTGCPALPLQGITDF